VFHINNIVHFDLKLGNILINPDLSIRICIFIFFFLLCCYICFEGDYGTAHNLTATRTDVYELGSLLYMAPEMIDLEGMY
jgi:serine/threonine protein kinase